MEILSSFPYHTAGKDGIDRHSNTNREAVKAACRPGQEAAAGAPRDPKGGRCHPVPPPHSQGAKTRLVGRSCFRSIVTRESQCFPFLNLPRVVSGDWVPVCPCESGWCSSSSCPFHARGRCRKHPSGSQGQGAPWSPITSGIVVRALPGSGKTS